MYFTLKLIRYFVGLFIRALLFPFKIVTGFVKAANSAGSGDSTEAVGTPSSPSSKEVTTGNSSVGTAPSDVPSTEITDPDDGQSGGPETPETVDGSEADSVEHVGEATDEVADEQEHGDDPDSVLDVTDAQQVDDADDVESTDETVSEGQTDEPSQHTDDSVVAAYQDELTVDDPTVRADAVGELADAVADDAVPDQAAIDALADRLDDEAATVRATACEALGRIGAADAKPRLRDRRIDPDAEVSRAASRALRELEQ